MSKAKLGGMVLGVLGVSILCALGALWVGLCDLSGRLARVEDELAARRVKRPARVERGGTPAGVATAPEAVGPVDGGETEAASAGDVAAMRGEMQRLRDQVAALQGQLAETAGEAQADGENAVAVEAIDKAIKIASSAKGMVKMGTGPRAMQEMELERIAEMVGLTDAQKDRARTVLRELTDKYLGKPWTPTEGAENPWETFHREWQEQLRMLMTSEQQVGYDGYQERKRQDQVRTTTHFTVSTLDDAVGLSSAQRDRISAVLREHYAKQPSKPGAMMGTESDGVKDAIRRELSADQLPQFDEWASRNLRFGTMGGNTMFFQAIEVQKEKK